MLCSGSGVVFIFSDTDITERMDKRGNFTVSLSISGCSFLNNTNLIPILIQANTFSFGFATQRISLTGGCSIAVYIGQRGFFVDTKVTNTVILTSTGNLANFVVMYYNTIRMSKTRLIGLVFSDNTCQGLWGRVAGLAIIEVLFTDSLNSYPQLHEDYENIMVEIVSSAFSRNSAAFGGAIFIYITSQNISVIGVVVRDTTLTDNVAFVGPALYIIQYESFIVSAKEVHVILQDIVASGNTFSEDITSERSPENGGVLLFGHITNVTVVGTQGKGCHFYNNGMSVFLPVATNLALSGRITFEDNCGFRGGALNLIDHSILFIDNGSTIRFTRNTASREGGAIYINTGSAVTAICAIQFLIENKAQFVHKELFPITPILFSNNSAMISGNSIYGNPLFYCQLIHIPSIEYIFNSKSHVRLYEKVFIFRDTVQNEKH